MPNFDALRIATADHRHHKRQEELSRRRRDREALKAVRAGGTWRAVAEIAGFTNSHIAYLQQQETQNGKHPDPAA